jgi:hypothetical protein
MKTSIRLILALVLTLVAVLAVPLASASAEGLQPAQLNFSYESEDDAGFWFGNFATRIRWFNQDVSLVSTPTLSAWESTSSITLDYFAYRLNGSAFTSITASPLRTFSAEGVYDFEATGINVVGLSYEGSRTLGIDKKRPTSSSNLVPVYTGSAKITITATDTLSGPEFVMYTLDGTSQRAVPGYPWMFVVAGPTPKDPNAPFVVDVKVTSPGKHRLSWFAVDNAGNHERWHDTTFLVNPVGYVPVLGKPSVYVRGHKATVRGTVTPAARPRPAVMTVQRKGDSGWKAFATYSWWIPKYAGVYSLKRTITKKGVYRVKTAEGTGSSRWSKEFTVE